MKGNTQDLTKGSIVKAIILFSIPLLIGNLFQQLYNAVDSYVVGNYVGKVALAAVGASTPIINMLIGFFMGISTGAGVVIAQFFGAGNTCKMKRAIHNSIALTLVMGVVLTIVGLLFNDPILKAIGVPSEVFSEASTYLSIYFWSLIFVMVYNMGSGILRSVGDSKRPLYFLIFSRNFLKREMHYFPCFFRSAIMAVRSSLVKFCTLSQNWQVSSAEPCSSTIFSSSFDPSDSSARSVRSREQ